MKSLLSAVLAAVVSFAAWLMVMWKYRRYAQMVYALYLVILGILGIGIVISKTYGFLGRRLLLGQQAHK